jgi:hypothetical protein
MTAELKLCPKGHERRKHVKYCNACKLEKAKAWQAANPEKYRESVMRYRNSEKGKAMIAKQKAKQLKRAKRKKLQAIRRTTTTRKFITAAKQFAKRFLECWEVTKEGATLPRQSLPTLHELRELADALARTKVQQFKPKINKA